MALSLVVAVMTAAVPAQWPVWSELFQVALASSFYTVAVTLSRITAFVAATLAAAAGQCGWLPRLRGRSRFELYGKRDRIDPRAERAAAQERPRQNRLFCAA